MFTRALAIKPAYAGAFAERGVAYSMLGKTEQALADFDQAITLLPDVAGFYFVRAQALERSGAFERAVADLDKAMELDPRVAAFFALRGRINAALGRHDVALADFSHALELDPRLTGARRWIQKLRSSVSSLRGAQGDKPASSLQPQAKAAPALEKMKPLKLLWPLCGKAHPYRGTPSRLQPVPSLLIGTPKAAVVKASEAGFVTNVEPVSGGSVLELSHRDGTSTLYGTLSIAFAQFGDLVAAGQVIGQVAGARGSEGFTFVVYRDGKPVAPLTLLPPADLCARQPRGDRKY
jgi:tetratricopeptide (TPR) repeat protein